mmetsp:Transcript_60622/g.195284  ORF Transcript_60622/g.195284 Transcript_60622/m.195284 type:complete len:504 (-) Transcript_60622:111-1622(-)
MGSEVKEAIKAAFREADQNGDGLISKGELKEAFQYLGEWTDEEFETLFQEADATGDGRLSYNEFVEWVMAEVEGDEEEAVDLALDAAEGVEGGDESGGEGGDSEEEGSDWEEEGEWGDWEDLGEEEAVEPPVEPPPDEAPGEEAGEAPFADEDFPAGPSSVGQTEGDTASGVVGESAGGWEHLAVLAGEGGSLFKDIRPNDVMQGMLGNCWFLAACASVASYPGWVRQIFSKNPELRPDGRYEVRLYHPGKKEFQYVVVSDEVPAAEGELSFSGLTQESEIWPCLLEKAFAKLCGSYAATEAGFPAWGMTYLCGGAGEQWDRQEDGSWTRAATSWSGSDGDRIDREAEPEGFEELNGEGDTLDARKLWAALLAYAGKNFPMCCSIGTIAEGQDPQGLISGHAYSLVVVREVKTGPGRSLKMCKVRNPHGETEWTGKWSDASDMWAQHPNVRKELKFRAKEDGTFWMSFHDFTKYFDTLSVNKRSMPLDDCHPDKLRAVAAMSA